jgi:hypothetical protein
MTGRTPRGSWSLIGLLVVAVLIGIAIYITLGSYLKSSHPGRGVATGVAGIAPGDDLSDVGPAEGQTPIGVAKDVQCREALDQMRKAIEMHKAQFGEGPPANLEALTAQGIPREWLVCPVGKEPYKYDPQTGRVWCQHPGHEKF